jgi:predicted TPR repeat methyltransferase
MFDVVADVYDDLATLAVNVGTARALLQAALEEAGPDPLVLDFGCGTGLAATSLKAMGRRARLLGVDLSSAMLRRAAARGETVIAMDEWRQSPPPVDAAIAAFVLHYGVAVEDLARIAGSLRLGGRFAANLFRPDSDDVHVLARRLATERMDLLATAEIGGTKAANVMVVFRKMR